jgi:glycosyltransferase involved in cell wall biosynthesis
MRPLRIALVGDSFPRNMGYLGTMLPKYLARLGAEVHYLAMDLPPYWQIPAMREQYAELIGRDWLLPGLVREHEGYTVHVLPHSRLGTQMRMRGLRTTLGAIRPDVVYSLTAVGVLPLECAWYCVTGGARLFTGSHMLASGFPLARHPRPWLTMAALKTALLRWLPGRLISLVSEKCYAPTVDCAEIAVRFFGVQQSKVEVLHLGVDTDVFFPVQDAASADERRRTRARLGFEDADLICIYTGKLTAEKNVVLLAEAVARLAERGIRMRLLCVGAGPQWEVLEKMPAVQLLAFRPYTELGALYRAADLAVWPTNESTSMLDAAACGLPIVVSDGVVYRDHVDGNGLIYRMNDRDDLERKLTQLADGTLRAQLGAAGALKMREHFSWLAHARRRLADFRGAVGPVSGL